MLKAAGVPVQGGREHSRAQNAQGGLVVFYNNPALLHLLIKMPNIQPKARSRFGGSWDEPGKEP